MPRHDDSKSKQNVSNLLENRWVKCSCLLPQQHQQREKKQPKFYHACVCANPFCSQLGLSLPNAHTHTRQQLLAEGMEGCMGTCLQSAGPENCRQQNCKLRKSVRETCVLLFHQSDLLGFCFIYQQPPHFYYEYFCFFIENLNRNRLVRQTFLDKLHIKQAQ